MCLLCFLIRLGPLQQQMPHDADHQAELVLAVLEGERDAIQSKPQDYIKAIHMVRIIVRIIKLPGPDLHSSLGFITTKPQSALYCIYVTE